jgi:hypothetical protein
MGAEVRVNMYRAYMDMEVHKHVYYYTDVEVCKVVYDTYGRRWL